MNINNINNNNNNNNFNNNSEVVSSEIEQIIMKKYKEIADLQKILIDYKATENYEELDLNQNNEDPITNRYNMMEQENINQLSDGGSRMVGLNNFIYKILNCFVLNLIFYF